MRAPVHRPSWSTVTTHPITGRGSEVGATTTIAKPVDGPAGSTSSLLAIGAILLRIPAFLAPTNLGYDDGGYGLAAIAMREGFDPFRDIFSSQGPLFLPLVRLADLAGLPDLQRAARCSRCSRARSRPSRCTSRVSSSWTAAGRSSPRRSPDRAASCCGRPDRSPATAPAPRSPSPRSPSRSPTAADPSTVTAIVIALLAGSAFSVKNLLVTPALRHRLGARRVAPPDPRRDPRPVRRARGADRWSPLPWGFTTSTRTPSSTTSTKTGEGNRGGNALASWSRPICDGARSWSRLAQSGSFLGSFVAADLPPPTGASRRWRAATGGLSLRRGATCRLHRRGLAWSTG